jgi:hypothetical protein
LYGSGLQNESLFNWQERLSSENNFIFKGQMPAGRQGISLPIAIGTIPLCDKSHHARFLVSIKEIVFPIHPA